MKQIILDLKRGPVSIVFLIFLSCLQLPGAVEARKTYPKVRLNQDITRDLDRVLASAVNIQVARAEGRELDVKNETEVLLRNLGKAQKSSRKAGSQSVHLDRMLSTARDQFQIAARSRGRKLDQGLKLGFAQIVNLAKLYKLKKYQIMFCPKDRSVWIQKGRRPQNPINPKSHLKCGRPV